MGGSPCWAKEGGLNRGAWTAQEDKILLEYVSIHGQGKWSKLPQRTGLKRSGKSCRLRWLNYLRPDIKRGNISPDEEELIIRLHKLLGNKWSLIAGRLPGRTDNEIKNYWNCKLSKKVEDSRTCASFAQHMKKTKMTSEPTPTPSLSSSPPNGSNNVILTKASKCSKVLFVDPLIPHSSMQLHSKKPNMEEPEAEAMGLHDVGNDLISSDKLMETNVNDDRVFRGEKSKDEELIALLSDFDVADLLNSDFSCVLNFCYDNEEDILPFWDQQMVSFFGVLKDKDCDEADNNLFLENENGC